MAPIKSTLFKAILKFCTTKKLFTFFFILKAQRTLKGLYFNDTNEARQAAKTWLTKWSADYFKNGIKGWKHCMEKCIDLDGDYVEK